ncbi:hypothetical protein EV08_0423 [Prochlorococcus marinus str. SS2]|nr:hypothetical protein EV04_0900 [Prochlorococcus marinus str. LG]KGG21818.1 hypothetical protein EV08_0423 [Prochlorococcus marinus str. SS2]KGG23751.1 hypothetical protein EV09_1376 [Prochlorococcus marinus str. SS35]
MLTSAAFAAKGANRPNAAGATSSCRKSFIWIPHTFRTIQLSIT